MNENRDGLDNEILEIIKNNLISVEGQKSLYRFIEKEQKTGGIDYLRWDGIPSYDKLWQTLYLGYKFLKSNDRIGFVQSRAVMSLKFVNLSLRKVIEEQYKYYLSHIIQYLRRNLSLIIRNLIPYEANLLEEAIR